MRIFTERFLRDLFALYKSNLDELCHSTNYRYNRNLHDNVLSQRIRIL